MLTGMLGTNPEEIMPAICFTQFDHRKATKGAISDDRTVAFANVRSQPPEQFFKTRPESLIPFLLPRHHFPDKRQHTGMLQQANVDHLCMFLIGCHINDQPHWLSSEKRHHFI